MRLSSWRAAMSFSFIACLTALHGASATEAVRIGFAVANLQNDVFNQIRQSAEASAKERGATLVVVDAGDDAAAQANQVSALVKQELRALIVIPAGPQATAAPVRSARAAGIPVVTVDRNPVGAAGDTFIGTDNVAAARALGEYACQITGGKANLEIIESTLHTRHEDDRNKGFTAAMERCPGISETDRDWTHQSAPKEGFDYATRALLQDPSISLIFGRVDTLALGAAQAVEAAHLDHKIFVIGFDGDPAALQAVKEGLLDATMTQRTQLIGQLAIGSALSLIAGQRVPVEQMQDAVLTTRENVDRMIASHP